jgi:uncharacterized protein involved in oxidation of intracellular sulfur
LWQQPSFWWLAGLKKYSFAGNESVCFLIINKKAVMKVLIVFNREPYDNPDVTWNGLRLAETLRKKGHEVRIFLMNDSVDMARDVCKPPEGYDQDLSQMLRDLISLDVAVKVCGTCMARCGIYKNHPYFEGAEKSTMAALADWVLDSDKILTF